MPSTCVNRQRRFRQHVVGLVVVDRVLEVTLGAQPEERRLAHDVVRIHATDTPEKSGTVSSMALNWR